MRFHVDPGDVPPEKAARRLGVTLADFQAALPRLLERGFPEADPDTGNFDLEAIDAWRRRRHPHLYDGEVIGARDASAVVEARIAAMRRRGDK